MSDVISNESKKKGCGFWVLVIIGVFIALVIIGSLLPKPTPEEIAEREAEETAERQAEADAAVASATEVTANQLWSAFEQNEVAAQSQYGDRSLLITGTIDSVTLDIMDEPVVSLQTGNQFQSVQLGFEKNDAEMIGVLSSGQQVTALCNELSEVVGTPMLDDCVLQRR